tara:strand:+ start:31936 stop:34959 length:3024 start_codon:yes stop_codon:yes gene_type:complete
MSVIGLAPKNFDTVTLQVNPKRMFASSSVGVTGSIYVYAQRSDIEKDADYTVEDADNVYFGADNLTTILETLKAMGLLPDPIPDGTDISTLLENYLELVKIQGPASRKQQQVEIALSRPTPNFSSASLAKNNIRKILYEDYKHQYHNLNWAYTNYNSLNFFTSSLNAAHGLHESLSDPTNGTALIYPAFTSSVATGGVFAAPYRTISSGFNFEFWINPRYNDLDHTGHFKAGTILHMSSCYAVSLVTGSERDLENKPSRFKLLLQLSHSAEIAPSSVTLGAANNSGGTTRSFPNDLIFESSASLKHNHWHHISINWDTQTNRRMGSFVIDGNVDSKFFIPSKSLNVTTTFAVKRPSNNYRSDPDALFLGNFYEGPNNSVEGNQIADFFNSRVARGEGIIQATPATADPSNFGFRHDLRAEVHEIRIWNRGFRSQFGPSHSTLNRQSLSQVSAYIVKGKTNVSTRPRGFDENDFSTWATLLFYLPVLFVKESPYRYIPITPFYNAGTVPLKMKTGMPIQTTIDPFNAPLSLTNNILQINLQNFVRNFACEGLPNLRKGIYPRLYNLTASINQEGNWPTTEASPSGGTYYSDGFGTWISRPAGLAGPYALPYHTLLGMGDSSNLPATVERVAKANGLLMPNDNGYFRPDFNLLLTGSITRQLGLTNEQQHFLDYTTQYLKPLSGSMLDKYTTDAGYLDLSLINLGELMWQPPGNKMLQRYNMLLKQSGLPELSDAEKWANLSSLAGPTPFLTNLFPVGFISGLGYGPNPDDALIGFEKKGGIITSVGYELLDTSSNMVTFFIIPQLYYGDRVRKKSMTITGRVGLVKSTVNADFKNTLSVTLKDDGHGNIYRADCKTPHATWNNVGDIIYEEGLAVIKSPHLYTLGRNGAQFSEIIGFLPGDETPGEGGGGTQIAPGEQFRLEFEGERNVHVLEVMIPAPAHMFASSSNPTYESLLPSDHVSDENLNFTYITSLNFHDDNFNIIARTNLAQPVIKRDNDKLFFRVKIDF